MNTRYLFFLGWVLFHLLLTACSSVDGVDEEETSTLRSAAKEHELLIGAAVGTRLQSGTGPYPQVLAREFNLVTAENAMKFGPLRPTRFTFFFDDADALVSFAEAQDMEVRGHTLIWHNQLPEWLTRETWTREQLLEVMREHITTVVQRYRGRVFAWDVVNEAIDDNGQLRNSIWYRVIGPEYIRRAFEYAHAADPEALLFYNDYGAEGSGTKSNAVYDMVSDLVFNGVPVHGVGFQMHFTTDWAPGRQEVAANMKRLQDLGLDVQITEMDVRMPMPSTTEKLNKQALVYRDMMDVCLDAVNCTAFVLWGFTDAHSWIPGTFNGYGAALIFDENYTPKPAYHALLSALK